MYKCMPFQKIISYHCRWRIVVDGGIDGYSRLPIYLKCSPNNCAETVRTDFVEAVSTYGLPLRVRCDHGGENFAVASFMWSQADRSNSVIMGQSVHNVRIERLWCDVFQGCTALYYQLFTHLENVGLLDPCNEIHLFALHFVYLPRIQRSLDHFRNAYIHHPTSSCHNFTPVQLFYSGLVVFKGTRELLTSCIRYLCVLFCLYVL